MRPLPSSKRKCQRGQTTILMVVALSLFLLGFVGLATDYASFWYTRQTVQGAADATCQAAATDLYLYAQGQQTPNMNFVPGNTDISCTAMPTPAPCIIAKYNGFDGTLASNTVVMSFPSNVTNPPLGGVPSGVSYPYVKVDVTTQAPAYFTPIMTGNHRVAVHASATCGLGSPAGPVPIVVLHPTMADAIQMKGAQNSIKIVGGPIRSVQVNSSAAQSVSLATIDLSTAGPDNNGGDFAVFGGPPTASQSGGTVSFGTRPGQWLYPSLPIADPYRNVTQPTTKPAAGTIYIGCYSSGKCAGQSDCTANASFPGCYKVNGCPDPLGCYEYTAGYYGPNGIDVKGYTAIFDPGLYWIEGGLTFDSNSIVRTSTASGDGSGGILIFLSGSPSGKCSGLSHTSLCITSNSGSKNGVDAYYINGSPSPNGVPSRALQCPGGAPNPSLPVTTIPGNVLLGPCPGSTGISGTYGDPSSKYRGFVLWQDRASVGNASWQGGGASLVSGFMYFHQCNPDGSGTEPCPGTAFDSSFNLGGNPGSTSYTIGSIVTDSIATNGTPNIEMVLSPYNSFPLLKVYLFQ
jgi:Flp pilus assembly protein TadG